MENLENVIESIAFVAGEPILVSDLCLKFDLKPKQVEKAVENLKKKYDGNSGIQILFFNNKIQFSSNPKYVQYLVTYFLEYSSLPHYVTYISLPFHLEYSLL